MMLLRRVAVSLPRDLPAAAHARARLRRRRGARPLPARPRHLAPLPLAVAAGARRLDARLRRRRPDARLGRARRRGGPARAAGRAASAIVLDIVPNHMGVSDENRWWADEALRARFFDWDPRRAAGTGASSTSTTSPAVRVEDPEVFDVTHGKVLELVREGVVDGLRVDHPDGLADPAGYLRRLRERGRRARLGREDPPPRRGAARLAGRGHGRLRVPQRRHGAVRRPGRRGRADRRCTPSSRARRGAFAEVALEAQVEQATTTFAREVARLRALLDDVPASPTRWPRCRSTAPTSSRGPGGSRPTTARRSRRPGSTSGWPARCSCAGARPRRVRRPASSRPRRR